MTAKYFNPDSFKVSIVGAMGKMGLDSIITIPISALEF
jgi:zinc protease